MFLKTHELLNHMHLLENRYNNDFPLKTRASLGAGELNCLYSSIMF